MRILITDDSLISRKKIRKMIEPLNFECDEALNGKEAVDKVNSGNFDLLILDLLMPEYDGFYALETLKNQGNKVPIIVISADIQDTSREKVFSLGASEFLNKPPKEDDLKSTIALLTSNLEIVNG